MKYKKLREIVFYKNYFKEFFVKQRPKVRDKILWVLKLIEIQYFIPSEYFKHIESVEGIYEIRVQQGSDIFRIFCFFDNSKIVVLANGFQKKTQKTPRAEIIKAVKIKKSYEEEKKS